MRLSQGMKWTFGVIGTLVLGALGSGLWELALKPGGQWVAKIILTAATLGSMALKDGLYREAAKGPHEQAALTVLAFLTAGTVIIFAALNAGAVLKMRELLISLRTLKEAFAHPGASDNSERIVDDDDLVIPSLGARIENLAARTKRLMWWGAFITVTLLPLTVDVQGIAFLEIAESTARIPFIDNRWIYVAPISATRNLKCCNQDLPRLMGGPIT